MTATAKLSKSSVSFAGRIRSQSSTHLTQRALDNWRARARRRVNLHPLPIASNANRWAALAQRNHERKIIMPVLNYHREVKDMPDMSKLQKCDTCGVEQIGNRMYYSHPKKSKIEVICRTCFISHPSRPTKRAADYCYCRPRR